VVETFYYALFVDNNQGFDKNINKRTHHKRRPKKRKEKKTQNPPFLGIFTFVVLLPIDDGVVVVTILLLCSKKWLLSYAPSCLQILKTRFITSFPNGTTNGLTTNLHFTKMELQPSFTIISFIYLN